MIWTTGEARNRNRKKRLIASAISTITVIALVVSLIFIPDLTPKSSGASLYAEWTTYDDFNNTTTPQTQLTIDGSGNPTDANAGKVKLTANPGGVNPDLGDGSDGSLNVASGTTTINTIKTVLSANVASGATSITVSDATGFAPNQKVLIIQMKDANGSTYSQLTNTWVAEQEIQEELEIDTVVGNTLNLKSALTRPNISAQSYDYPASYTQVLKIMQYTDVDISTGATLTAPDFDGSTGGVIAFKASGTLTVNSSGKIYASKLGHLGGVKALAGPSPRNGNGIGKTVGSYQRTGGGGYGGAGATGHSSSVGGTAYGAFPAKPNIGSSAGGTEYYLNTPSRASTGGDGGGLIIIQTNILVNDGQIISDGQNGESSWSPSGGGSGGGIYIISPNSIDASNLFTRGGNGAAYSSCCMTETGGGGGGGQMLVQTPQVSATPDAANYQGGTSSPYSSSPGVFFSLTPFQTPGILGGSNPSDVGLRTDAGTGVKANWSSLTFNSAALLANQTIKFAIRTSDDGSTWSDLKGRLGANIDWTTGTGNYFGQVFGESIYSDLSNIVPSRYIDIVIRLESLGGNTPILNDVRLDYDTIDAPNAGNLSIYRNDGTTQIPVPDANGGWTNETTVKAKIANMDGLSDTSTLTPQVEVKNVGTAFDGTGVTDGTGVAYSGSPVIGWVTLSSLTVGQDYHFRVRLKDNLNRVSAWTNFNNNNTAFTIEQTAPTGSVSINSGATYATSASVTLDLSSATDPGAVASGVDQVMVSEDSGFLGASWQSYSASLPFALSSGDELKNIYVKIKDKAGNIHSSGTFTDTFTATTYKDAANTTANWDTIAGEIKLPASYAWLSKAAVPGAVDNGGALAYDSANNKIYALRGNGTSNFYEYNSVSNTWASKASAPSTVGQGGALTYNSNDGKIYAFPGYKNPPIFWAYDPTSNSWSTKAAPPATIEWGASLAFNPNDGKIYAFRGNTTTFWAYDPIANSWSTKASAPAKVFDGGSLAFNSSDGKIYALRGWGSKNFYVYDVGANSWTSKASTPSFVGGGAGLAYNSSDGKLYALAGAYANTSSMSYDPSVNSWTNEASMPSAVTGGGALVYNTNNSKIYALRGDGSTDYWAYEPAYQTANNVAQALTVDSTAGIITKATLSASETLNGQSISYQMSRDGGTTWETVTKGVEHDFTSTDAEKSDLRWKATLTGTTSTTPIIEDITINFDAPAADSITLDTTAPSVPTVSTYEDSSKAVSLTDGTFYTHYQDGAKPYFEWSASTDPDPGDSSQSGLENYYVYFGTNASADPLVDGASQATTNYTAGATDSDGSAITTGTYYLKVAAKDNATNSSSDSFTYKLDITAPDTSATTPNASTSLGLIQLTWAAPSDGVGSGIAKYYVYWDSRDVNAGDPVPTVNETNVYTQTIPPSPVDITTTTFNDTSASASLTYYYKIKAIDNVGNISSLSLQGGPGYVADTSGPSIPSSVTPTAQSNGTQINLNWGAVSDNVGVAGYKIYRTINGLSNLPSPRGIPTNLYDYALAGTVSHPTTTFSDTNLIDNKRYYYRVIAYDTATPNANWSDFSEDTTTPPTATDITPDVTSPLQPSWVTTNGGDGTDASTINLVWNEPNDLSNDGSSAGTGVSGYNVYRSTDSYDGNGYAVDGTGILRDNSNNDPVTPTFGTSVNNSDTTYPHTGRSSYTWYAYKLEAYDGASTPNTSPESSIIWVRTLKNTTPVDTSVPTTSTPDGDADTNDDGIEDPGTTIGTTVTINFNGGASIDDVLDSYEIYRATSSGGPWTNRVAEITNLGSVTNNPGVYNDDDTASSYSFTDTGLSDNTTYYYKIRVVDTIGVTTYQNWTDAAVSLETVDTTPPTAPSAIVVTDLYPKGAISGILTHPMLVINWPHITERDGYGASDADKTFYEYRLYRRVGAGGSWTRLSSVGFQDNYYVDDTVAANTEYYYMVRAADGPTHTWNGGASTKIGNPSPKTTSVATNPSEIDKVAPSIFTRNESVEANSATINVSLSEVAEAKVEVGSSCGSYTRTVGTPLTSIAPSITVRNLIPGSTYAYRVIVVDANDNKLISSCVTLSTPAFSISDDDLSKSVSVSSATLGWKANASADSFIKYTNTKTKETKIVANDEVKGTSAKHSLSLKGLSAGTKYTYTLISKDEYSNRATKAGSFTTAKFKATKVSVSTTVSSAIVTWKTNVKSDSFVEFGRKSTSDDQTGLRVKTKTHKVVLKNLKPGTKYKFRVASKDANDNVAIKADSDGSFETKPFKITGAKKNTSTNSATITWKTNVASTSSVEYRSATDKVSQLAGDAKLTKTHKVAIKGLEDDTTYSYRIKSRNKEDNIAESKLLSFKTGSLEREYDVTPTVSDLDEMELSATSAKIAWTTAGETSSWVEYGTSRSLGKNAGNDTMTVDHIVELTNLTPGITYYYRVKGEDEAGNKYQSAILTFTALVEPKITQEPTVKATNDAATITWKTNTDTDSIVEYGLTEKYGDSSGSSVLSKEHEVKLEGLAQSTEYNFKVGGVDNYSVKVMSANSTFKTSKDTTGPKIEDIRNEILRSRDAENKEKISVIVNFTTNEEATSYIEYAEGITMATYNKKTRMNNTLNLSHSALIEGLNPATTYHYRIVTKDKYSNMTKSPDKTILTPKETETVLQKIIKVLEETFSWVSNLRDYLNRQVSSIRM